MDATHSSTCKCKKLFQVYLKNKSCTKRVGEMMKNKIIHPQPSHNVESAIFSVGVCK